MTGPPPAAPGDGDPYAPGGRFHKPDPQAEVEPEPRWQYEIDAERRAAARSAKAAGRRDRLKNVGGPFGFALLLIWKVGRVALVALGKVAILFKIPLLGTVLSGAISIGAYAVFFGWSFAIGLVGSLLVHELGHVVQIRREGMPVKALNFVPFLGAYVLSDAARSADQQARISIAGPVAGTLLALAIYALAAGDPLLEAIAYTGFFLNLFNLFPVPGLDGGGVGSVFTAGWWLVIAAVTGVAAYGTGVGFAALAAIAALLMAYLRRATGLSLDPVGGDVRLGERATAAVLYSGVIVVCALGMNATFRDRTDELVNRYGSVAAPVTVVAPGAPAQR